jgi:hypothetical protein
MADNLVTIRDRREQVIARLGECYATDVLDFEELERRLDLAHGARSLAELEVLVSDLARAPTALVPTASHAIDDPERAVRTQLSVIFGSLERTGRWSVPRVLRLRVWWGNAQLDLREASLGPGLTTIELGVRMGNLEVILPPWLAVDVDVSSVLGSVEERHRIPPDPDPDRPIVRFVGTVVLGRLELVSPGKAR